MTTRTIYALVAGLFVFGVGSAADPASTEVEKSIRVLNDAYEAGNARVIKSLVVEDHISVTPYGGRQDLAEQLKTLPELKLTEYDAGKIQVKLLGNDTALVTYTLTQKGTFKGKDVPRKCYTSAVWIRQGGKWLEAHYQETATDEK